MILIENGRSNFNHESRMNMTKNNDLTGSKYGRWTVLEYDGTASRPKWMCQCECGTARSVDQYRLLNGKATSCGCHNNEATAARKTTHGQNQTRTYRIWAGMIQRCENPNKDGYENYGGRGISVSLKWRSSFEAFLADMGEAPPRMSIDRIENAGNYTNGNCRWATSKQQGNNTRKNIVFEGRTMEEWSAITGIKAKTLSQRMLRKGSIYTRNPKAIPIKKFSD